LTAPLRFGLFVPNFGAGFGDARPLAELAAAAEQAGWDGFFLWDHVAPSPELPTVDPWVALAAIALATKHLRIGALVTPLPRRRPWVVARSAVSVERLSGGRLVFGAGIGSGRVSEWGGLGEETDARRRAEMLDESLAVLEGLWSGERFAFQGKHYRVDETRFLPAPLQRPRIPIWIACYWPTRAPLRRAARFDGMFPLFRKGEPAEDQPRLLAEAVGFVRSLRPGGAPFDVVHCEPPLAARDHDRAGARVRAFREAGATWWLERLVPEDLGGDWLGNWPTAALRERIHRGPPPTAGTGFN
jgi:alkanesulfonate monooxygenase SsuD/methylene tetrahydromethanopterin reductase-like flavin-dependent oxidoreductase (luciferase family)